MWFELPAAWSVGLYRDAARAAANRAEPDYLTRQAARLNEALRDRDSSG